MSECVKLLKLQYINTVENTDTTSLLQEQQNRMKVLQVAAS